MTDQRSSTDAHPTTLRAWVREFPTLVSLAILSLVGVQALLGTWLPWLRPVETLATDDAVRGSTVEIYLAVAGVAGLTGSFSGVVMVFALQSDSPSFRRFRLKTKTSLRSNVRSIIGSPFAAAVLSVAAAICLLVRPPASGYLAEIAVLLLIHSYVRLVWLLGQLIRVVLIDDDKAEATEQESAKSVFARRQAS